MDSLAKMQLTNGPQPISHKKQRTDGFDEEDTRPACRHCGTLCVRCNDLQSSAPSTRANSIPLIHNSTNGDKPPLPKSDQIQSLKPNPRQPSSKLNQVRIMEVGKILEKMGDHDIQNLVASNSALQKASRANDNRHKNRNNQNLGIDQAISSIGSNEEVWTNLIQKHRGLRDFLSNWHNQKLDEKAGVVPKRKRVVQQSREEFSRPRKRQRQNERKAITETGDQGESVRGIEGDKRRDQVDRKWERFQVDTERAVSYSKEQWEGAQDAARKEQGEISEPGEIDREMMENWAKDI